MGEREQAPGSCERAERFVQLLAPYRLALERIARHALDAPEEAEDVLQAALLHAFRDFDGFVPGTNFAGFLCTYVLNEARTVIRRRLPEALAEADEPAAEADDVL